MNTFDRTGPAAASPRAFSSVELVVTTLILAGALIPLYRVFVTGSTVTTQSRLSYLAIHAAREELEELRQTPLEALAGHDWAPVKGGLFDRTIRTRRTRAAGGATAAITDNPLSSIDDLRYPDEYGRILTRVQISDDLLASEAGWPAGVQMKKVALDVQWQEHGEQPADQPKRESISHFETLLVFSNPERVGR